MDDLQRRRYEREQRRLKQLELDLAPEKLLMEEMAQVKKLIGKSEPMVERIRAYANLEGKD